MPSVYLNHFSADIADLPAVSATELKNAFSGVWETMNSSGAVAITRHEKPKAVLISIERFQELLRAGRPALEELTSEFDALLDRMQAPKSKRALDAAYRATPAQLGKAAVAAARKKPKTR